MAPLGLEVTERPQGGFEMRDADDSRGGPEIRGAIVLSGERHGRPVTVRLGGERGPAPARSASPSPARSSRRGSRDGRVRAARDEPARRRRGAEGSAELDPVEAA